MGKSIAANVLEDDNPPIKDKGYPESKLPKFLATIGITMLAASLTAITLRGFSVQESAASILLSIIGAITGLYGIAAWRAEERMQKHVFEVRSQMSLKEIRFKAKRLQENYEIEMERAAADILRLRGRVAQEEKMEEKTRAVTLPPSPAHMVVVPSTLPDSVSKGLSTRISSPIQKGPSGSFQISGLLAQGGSARVYAGVDTRDGKKIVVKEPWGYRTTAEKGIDGRINPYSFARERLLKEKEFLERTKGMDDIVEYVDTYFEDGEPRLVLRFVEGQTLKDYVKAKKGQAAIAGLDMQETLDITKSIATTVRFIHEELHLVHRDLTPHNIIMRQGQPVLFDFGTVSVDTGIEAMTSSGIQSGGYHAPEQERGVSSKLCDIYSLGSVIYFMLTGEDPPGASFNIPAEKVMRYRLAEAGVPSAMQDIVLKARAIHPQHRYSSLAEFQINLLKLEEKCERRCPRCGKQNKADAKRCESCGSPILSAKPARGKAIILRDLASGSILLFDADTEDVGRSRLRDWLSPENLDFVSREVFRLIREDSNFFIETLQTMNPVELNGEALHLGKRVQLKDADQIRLAGGILSLEVRVIE